MTHSFANQPLLIGPSLAEALAEAREIVDAARRQFPHVAVVALFSGGNDSTVMLHSMRDVADFALHINTGIGIEQTRAFVRETAALWDMGLVEKRTDPEWYRRQVLKNGFPGPMAHKVMYHNLKRDRLRDLRREICGRGEKLLLLSGERAYESRRRASYGDATARLDPRGGLIWVDPIRFFTDWHMYQYRQYFALPRNPVSDRIHKSGECLCGAFAKRAELREIETWFPEAAENNHELERLAEEAGHGKRAKWAWGSEGRRPSAAPGPMCSSCHQTTLEDAALDD